MKIYDKPLVYADSIPGGVVHFLDECCALLPNQKRRLSKRLQEHLATQPDDYTDFIADIGSAEIIFKNREEQLIFQAWLSDQYGE